MLDTHKNIAIDIDDTLIGDGVVSHKIQNYIIKNYRNKNFYLITFRTGTWVDDVWQDIAYENDQIDERMFKGLYGVPYEFREGYQKYAWYARMQFKNDPEIDDRVDELAVPAMKYLEWKGYQAHTLGCTVLVDDMTEQVERGCNKYNVKLYHPREIHNGLI